MQQNVAIVLTKLRTHIRWFGQTVVMSCLFVMVASCAAHAAEPKPDVPDPSKPGSWAPTTNNPGLSSSREGYLNRDGDNTKTRGDTKWNSPFYANAQPKFTTFDSSGAPIYRVEVDKYEVTETPAGGGQYNYKITKVKRVAFWFVVTPVRDGTGAVIGGNVSLVDGATLKNLKTLYPDPEPELPLPIVSFLGTILASGLSLKAQRLKDGLRHPTGAIHPDWLHFFSKLERHH